MEDGVAVVGVELAELVEAVGEFVVVGGEWLAGGAFDDEVVDGDVEGFGEADEGGDGGGEFAVFAARLGRTRERTTTPTPQTQSTKTALTDERVTTSSSTSDGGTNQRGSFGQNSWTSRVRTFLSQWVIAILA